MPHPKLYLSQSFRFCAPSMPYLSNEFASQRVLHFRELLVPSHAASMAAVIVVVATPAFSMLFLMFVMALLCIDTHLFLALAHLSAYLLQCLLHLDHIAHALCHFDHAAEVLNCPSRS